MDRRDLIASFQDTLTFSTAGVLCDETKLQNPQRYITKTLRLVYEPASQNAMLPSAKIRHLQRPANTQMAVGSPF